MTRRQRPHAVRIVEVGPRDGLQNEEAHRADRREGRVHRGARRRGPPGRRGDVVRAPTAVPQLADADEVLPARASARPACATRCSCRTCAGLERAEARRRRRGRRVHGRLRGVHRGEHRHDDRGVARRVRARARRAPASAGGGGAATSRRRSAAPTRATSSPRRSCDVASPLLELGCDEISIGDTIGVADARRRAPRSCDDAPRAHARRPARAASARHQRPGARQRRGRPRARRPHLRLVGGGHRRMSLRARRPRQPRDRGAVRAARRLGIAHGVDADRVAAAAAALRAQMA